MTIGKSFLFTFLLLLINAALILLFSFPGKLMKSYPDFSWIYEGGITTFCYLLAYVLMFYFLFKWKPDLKNRFKIPGRINGSILFFTLLIMLGLRLVQKPISEIPVIFDFLPQYTPGKHGPKLESSTYDFLIINRFITSVLIAPLVEELFFRKYLFRKLLERHSFAVAALVSSLCFMLIHIPKWANLLPALIFGIVACYIYHYTKRLIYPVFLHLSGNLLVFLLGLYGSPVSNWYRENAFNGTYWLLVVAGFGIGLFGLISIRKATHNIV